MMAGGASAAALAERARRLRRRRPPAASCASATSPNVTHAPCPRRASRRGSSRTRSATSTYDAGLQRRTSRDRGALGLARSTRRTSARNSADQHVHPVRRRVRAHRRRRGHRRRGARRARRHRLAGRPRGHRRSRRRSSATRRTWHCGSGSPTRATRPTPPAAATCRSRPPRTRRPSRSPSRASLDGAWLPEPWVSRLIVDAGAHVLEDEADLREDGEFRPPCCLVRGPSSSTEHPGRGGRPAGGPRGSRRSGSTRTPTRHRP